MKDFLSKFTFGFILAQFFPGAISIVSISTIYWSLTNKKITSIIDLFLFTCKHWIGSNQNIIIFVSLSIILGMVIHGINWSVLGAIENHRKKSISETYWYNKTIFVQLLLSPITMLRELILVLKVNSIDSLAITENVSKIKPKYMPNYNFLQEFYLNFGEFFSHVSYAMIISLLCMLVNTFILFANHSIYILSWHRIAFLLLLYFMISILFLIGRIQLVTLFNAENELREESSKE
jgi:hypothetical protein